MKIMELKDGRKGRVILETTTRIWLKVDGIESAWNKDGKWRDDNIESSADIIMSNQLKLEL